MTKTLTNSEALSSLVVKGMQEKKAKDVVLIDLRDLEVAVSDFFIVCHAESDRQVKAIADSIIDEVKKELGERPFSSEGKGTANWVLLDYANVVAHIFRKDIREYYNLEALWHDGKTVRYEDVD
jgi:ribosome-associated protein